MSVLGYSVNYNGFILGDVGVGEMYHYIVALEGIL